MKQNYYQKAAVALKLTRYAVTLIFVLFVISCVFLFRNDITIENVQYLMKYADFYDNNEIPDAAQISISSDSESHHFMLRDNLAVVSRTGIGLYEFSGRKLFNYDLPYSNPGVAHDKRNVLVYDITGNEISIFNSFSRVYTQKFPYSVKLGCINESGFAIVTNEKTYRSGVIVYNSNFEEVLRWMSSERYVTALDLSYDGKRIVTGAVTTQGGSYNTEITIMSVSTGEYLHKYTISDELALKAGFTESGNVYIITDSMIHFLNDKLELTDSIKYNQSKTEKFFVENNTIVLTESNNLIGNSVTLHAYSTDGNKLFEVNCDSEVSSVAIGKTKLYALSSRFIYAYNINQDGSLEFISKTNAETNAINVLCDSVDRCITTSKKTATRRVTDQSDSEQI